MCVRYNWLTLIGYQDLMTLCLHLALSLSVLLKAANHLFGLKHFAGIDLRRQNLSLYQNLTSKVDPALKE